jgi:hypothetical protein
VLVVNRFRVGSDDGAEGDGRDPRDPVPAEVAEEFAARGRAALAAFAGCAGFVSGRLGRAADDPRWWCLVTSWQSVGAYRRALSSWQVKLDAAPLLADSVEEPSAYEVLATTDGGPVETAGSDRSAGPGGAGRSR